MAIQKEYPEQRDYSEEIDSNFIENPQVPKRVLVGDEYLTVGGWTARVVHITANRYWFYAIHKPDHPTEESYPIMHNPAGIACYTFSVGAPPTYDVPQPADILLDKKTSN